jgi:beta-N-acetylhexosaminidase
LVSRVSATILGLEGPVLEADEAMFFAEAQPWGFILFARNVQSPEQLRRLTGDLRDALGRDAPILIDQEGGRVQRLRPPHWRDWMPALDQMAVAGPERGPRSMHLRSRLIAAELRDVGIDVNCTPLADVARSGTHPVLLNRLYGHDPETVAEAALAVALGMMEGGVVPVLKHLPGYGLGEVDSHETLPRVTADEGELRRIDFAAFEPLAHLPLGMTAHVVYDVLDPDRPATLSPRMIRLIREEIGFGGLLMTDDLSMGALPGPVGARAARARAAGCDLILHCNGDRGEVEDVLSEAGRMDDDALARGEAALALRDRVEPLDMEAAEAELADLLQGEVHG